MGEHYAENYSLSKPFDKSKLKKPANALVDDSDQKYAEYLMKLRLPK